MLADGSLEEDQIRVYTNDSDTIDYLMNATLPAVSLNYSYSCAPGTFLCKDPVALNQTLNCNAFQAPAVDTLLNKSCGLFTANPRYGDGQYESV